MMKNQRIQLALTGGVALYGLRWSLAALRTHFQVKPKAEAGDPAAKASVVQRPEASLLGIPNASYGVAYYAGLLALVLARRLDTAPWRTLVRAATLAALLRTLTLLAALLRSRTWCPVCMRAHVVNAALALLILPGWARR
jgi:uncharacterized membrane protein